jgi:hypothetical protein
MSQATRRSWRFGGETRDPWWVALRGQAEGGLNDEAREGWQLKSITHADVKGRIGPGGVEDLTLTFERPVA